MTLRLSSSRRSRSRQIHRGRQKRVKYAEMSSLCWSFFSTSKELPIRNSYLLVKSSMASFTVRFWSGWGRAFGANLQTSGRTTIGFSTMTTRPFTHHSLFDNSWLPKTLQWSPPPHSPELAPCDFFLLPNIKLRLKGRRFNRTKEIYAESQEVIDTLIFENFQGCKKSWETCWDRCIRAQGDYFDEDGGNQELRQETFLWPNTPNFWVAPRILRSFSTTPKYTQNEAFYSFLP